MMHNATEVRRELELLFRTRSPAVALVTWEETRALKLVRDVARLLSPSRDLMVWSGSLGLRLEGQPMLGLPTPCTMLETLTAAMDHKGPAIFAFLDPDLSDPKIARAIRDFAAASGNQPRSLLFIAPHFAMHSTLLRMVQCVQVPPPERNELKNLLSAVAGRCRSLVGVEIQLEGEAPERLAEAARGLALDEAERAFVRALLQVQRLSAGETPIVLAEKRRLLEQEPLLTQVPTGLTLDDLGGLEVIRTWLKQRSRLMPRSDDTQSISPRGVLLVGMPGCGRSHLIKGMATQWEYPLVRLETVGLTLPSLEVERLLRSALDRLSDLAPCTLWIPGIDRLFARQMDSEGGSALSPAAATLQAWLLERDPGVVVAATSDEPERVPLDLLWKQAFDEIFFVDFPSSDERRQIIKVLVKRKGMTLSELHPEMLVAASEDFSGAQIEQALDKALREAVDRGRPVQMVDIIQCFRQMTPMAGIMGERRRKLQKWAHRRAVAASPVRES